MPCPSRLLPECAGTRGVDALHPWRRARLEICAVTAYVKGRSLRETAELVERIQTAVRRVLNKHQVLCRPVGVVSTRARHGVRYIGPEAPDPPREGVGQEDQQKVSRWLTTRNRLAMFIIGAGADRPNQYLGVFLLP